MNTTPLKPALASLTVLVLLVGCQTTQIKEAKVTKPLAPMDDPQDAWTVGSTYETLKNGTEKTKSEVIAVEGNLVTWKNSSGCTWTRNHKELPFASWSSWKGCSFPNGTNTMELIEDVTIFPLTVGKSWSYRQNGSNAEGRNWNTVRKCEVESQVNITTHLGNFDTYKVVCANTWNDYTWYVAPSYKMTVKHIRHRRNQNSTNIYETAAFTKK